MSAPAFQLIRDPFGHLVLTDAQGEIHHGVVPVRAFPIAAPEAGIALVSPDGREAAWIDQLSDLPPAMAALVTEELASREFVPDINAIREVSSFATPSTWQVVTDRGDTQLILKGEEDIRRLAQGRLLIADSHGIHYLIRDPASLDNTSRKILDRFL